MSDPMREREDWELRIDAVLRDFQSACEDYLLSGVPEQSAASKHRAILRNELRQQLLEKELWVRQATENAKDVLRMNWLEAAGGKYDLTCWNVDWPNKNNGWAIGSDDEIDNIAKGATARDALDEAIAKHPEVLASGSDTQSADSALAAADVELQRFREAEAKQKVRAALAATQEEK